MSTDGEEVLGDAGGTLEIEPLRQREAVRGGNETVLGVAAAGCQRAHLVADVPAGRALAQRRNAPRDFEADDR
jgi:hypothetical protein